MQKPPPTPPPQEEDSVQQPTARLLSSGKKKQKIGGTNRSWRHLKVPARHPSRWRRQTVSDDGLGGLVRTVTLGPTAFVWLHFLGLAALMLKPRRVCWSVAFLPIWAADCAAIATEVWMVAMLRELKFEGGYNRFAKRAALVVDGSYGAIVEVNVLGEDALLIVRRTFTMGLATLPLLGVAVAAQCLALLSLVRPHHAAYFAIRCLSMVLTLQTVVLVAYLSLKSRGSRGVLGPTLHGLLWLAILGSILVCARHRQRRREPVEFLLALALAPFWCAKALLATSLLSVLRRYTARVYSLTKLQLASLILTLLCCLLTTTAEVLAWHFNASFLVRSLFVVGLGVGAAGFHAAMKIHAIQLKESRGHVIPTKLERNSRGHWVPSPEARTNFWFMLGTFDHRGASLQTPPPCCLALVPKRTSRRRRRKFSINDDSLEDDDELEEGQLTTTPPRDPLQPASTPFSQAAAAAAAAAAASSGDDCVIGEPRHKEALST